MSVRSLLRNNSFILALALVVGLLAGQGAVYTRPAVTPLLAAIMTLSLVGISSDVFMGGSRLVRPVGLALLLNYLLLGGLLLVGAVILFQDPAVRAGYVLLAAVPPAVAVIPFTARLGGDLSFTLLGAVACYFAAFVITPLVTLLVLGGSLLTPGDLATALLEFIAIPFALSRLLRRSGRFVSWLDRYRGALLNWGFFVVVYTIIGLNSSAFFSLSPQLGSMAVIAFVCTFGVAHAVYGISRRVFGASAAGSVSYAVMAAWKNYALAGAIALAYFGDLAALPAGVTTAFAIANFVVLNITIAVK